MWSEPSISFVIEVQEDSCADELKPRRSREKCSKEVLEIENQVIAKRPSTEESLVRYMAVGRTCCCRCFSAAHSK